MPEVATESTPEESADSLIDRAGEVGHRITKDQLVRWHRADLLPRPRQVSRGRQGSEIYYPAGTGVQLLDLLKLKERYRPLATIRWGLWWLGYPVPDHWAREFIEKQSREMLKTYGEFITPEGELTEKANAALDKAPTAEIAVGTMRRARRRVGVEDFDFFMQDLLLVGSGNVDVVKDEDLELLEHGMAMDRARKDNLATLGGPWLTTDIREDFTNISKLNDPKLHLESSHQPVPAIIEPLRCCPAMLPSLGASPYV